MANIKTCEEYVIAHLEDLERQVEMQKAVIETLTQSLNEAVSKYTELMEHIKPRIRLNHSHNDFTSEWVDFDNVWKRYDGADFDWFVETFELSLPEKSTEEENTEDGEEV